MSREQSVDKRSTKHLSQESQGDVADRPRIFLAHEDDARVLQSILSNLGSVLQDPNSMLIVDPATGRFHRIPGLSAVPGTDVD